MKGGKLKKEKETVLMNQIPHQQHQNQDRTFLPRVCVAIYTRPIKFHSSALNPLCR